MKDFISKVTFGFLMAQLLPGALVVITFSCLTGGDALESCHCLKQILDKIENLWFRSTFTILSLLFISVAVGMLIHGLNWTVIAYIENKNDIKKPKPVRETKYHNWPIWKQLLVSPIIIVYEILALLVNAPNIENLTLDENIIKIKSESIQQFQFIQDFYLHFGQFYAHMAYALLFTFICIFRCLIKQPSWSSFGILIFVYFLTSIFFIMGRVQLGSLFKAENALKRNNIDINQ